MPIWWRRGWLAGWDPSGRPAKIWRVTGDHGGCVQLWANCATCTRPTGTWPPYYVPLGRDVMGLDRAARGQQPQHNAKRAPSAETERGTHRRARRRLLVSRSLASWLPFGTSNSVGIVGCGGGDLTPAERRSSFRGLTLSKVGALGYYCSPPPIPVIRSTVSARPVVLVFMHDPANGRCQKQKFAWQSDQWRDAQGGRCNCLAWCYNQ